MPATRTLRTPEPIHLGMTLGLLARGPYDPTTRVSATEVWRATRTADGPATLHVTAHGEQVRARAWGPGAEAVLSGLEDLLGMDDRRDAFRAHHGIVRSMYRRARGLRLGRTGNVIEALIPSILEQKVTSNEAHRSFSRLVRRYGERAPGPADLMLQPSPEQVAALPYYALHPLGVERKRADTLRRACAHAPKLQRLVRLPAHEAQRTLRLIDGIGVWTAAEVARDALGDPDAVSVGDYHLKNIVAWALAGEARATDDRMLELLEPYRGQRARAIRLIELSGVRPPRFGPRVRLRAIERI